MTELSVCRKVDYCFVAIGSVTPSILLLITQANHEIRPSFVLSYCLHCLHWRGERFDGAGRRIRRFESWWSYVFAFRVQGTVEGRRRSWSCWADRHHLWTTSILRRAFSMLSAVSTAGGARDGVIVRCHRRRRRGGGRKQKSKGLYHRGIIIVGVGC